MRPDFLDKISDDPVFQQMLEDEKERNDRRKNRIHRGFDLKDDALKHIMQIPDRFDGIRVYQTQKINYVELFNIGQMDFKISEYFKVFFDSEMENRRPIHDDDWFYDVFLGTDDKDPLFEPIKIKSEDNEYSNIIDEELCSRLDKIMAYGDIRINKFKNVMIGMDPEILKIPDPQRKDDEPCPSILSKYDMTIWFSFLKSKIPVKLVSEDGMPELKRIKSHSDYERRGRMESLGVYTTFTDLSYPISEKPIIYICPKRIKENAEKNGIDWKNLFIIVYLHELAHVALDPRINVDEDSPEEDYYEYSICFDNQLQILDTNSNESAFAMEESLANAIMLYYLKEFGDIQLFEEALCFVRSQRAEYCFGINQFEAKVDWTKWREYKSKHQVPDEKLDEWYYGCFVYTQELFNKVFSEDQKAVQ